MISLKRIIRFLFGKRAVNMENIKWCEFKKFKNIEDFISKDERIKFNIEKEILVKRCMYEIEYLTSIKKIERDEAKKQNMLN